MKIVSFELTMPNVGSWNGKWTGSDKKYFKVRKFTNDEYKEKIEPLMNNKEYENFYYSFGDGWGANIRMEIINSEISRKRQKISAGFCGYEWMIDSIIKNGKIVTNF